MENDQILELFKPLVKTLGKTLGDHFEIVLHDVSDISSSVIAIENNHITNRDINSPATDLLVEMLNSAEVNENNKKLNYTSRLDNGKLIKSSTTLIKNTEGEIIGAFCINIDLSSIIIAENFLEQIAYTDENEIDEQFPNDANKFIEIMIKKAASKINVPIELASKDDKLEIVAFLDENNIFDFKGAVVRVANKLNVSKFTIYNYLEELRSQVN
jgi:predicted transcriptional regulator YheO